MDQFFKYESYRLIKLLVKIIKDKKEYSMSQREGENVNIK